MLGLKETAEEMVKNKLEGKDNLTPWQKYLEKKKEKRMLKKKKKVMFVLPTLGKFGVCYLKSLLLFILDKLSEELYSSQYILRLEDAVVFPWEDWESFVKLSGQKDIKDTTDCT